MNDKILKTLYDSRHINSFGAAVGSIQIRQHVAGVPYIDGFCGAITPEMARTIAKNLIEWADENDDRA